MTDFAVALGLALALEGLLFAAFPGFVRRRMTEALTLEPAAMRAAGIATAVCGVAVVAVVRLLLW